MLNIDIQYLIHVKRECPKLVTVYRPILPWELWATRTHAVYGKMILIPDLCYGSEDTQKFSEENTTIVNSYTDAEETARKYAAELGLIIH